MTSAIRLNDRLSVIVTIRSEEPVEQLTSRGFQHVQQITARIYEARGLRVLGEGVALRQPEDVQDDEKGAKLALTRAIEDASVYGNFDKAARTVLWNTYTDAVQQEKLQTFQRQRQLERFKGLVQGLLQKPAEAYQQNPFDTFDAFGPGRMAPTYRGKQCGEEEGYGFGI